MHQENRSLSCQIGIFKSKIIESVQSLKRELHLNTTKLPELFRVFRLFLFATDAFRANFRGN